MTVADLAELASHAESLAIAALVGMHAVTLGVALLHPDPVRRAEASRLLRRDSPEDDPPRGPG